MRIHDRVRVDLMQTVDDRFFLVAAYDRLAQRERLAAVPALAVHDTHTVPEIRLKRLGYRFRLRSRHLHHDLGVPVVEVGNCLRGNKLEHNRIARVFPAEEKSENDDNAHVENKDLVPNAFVQLIGNIQSDKVCAARRAFGTQRDDDDKAIQEAAENHVEKQVVEDGLEMAHIQ